MNKDSAIRLLGGTRKAAAAAIGISPAAIAQWPDPLPARIEDRVLAALARRHLPAELIGTEGAPPVAAETGEAAHG